jgi:RNA polymerase-interacting CarD/CdnL/TRCF family regulator
VKTRPEVTPVDLPLRSEVMVPFWGLCQVLDLVDGNVGGHPARLYILQPEGASHTIQIPQQNVEELGVRPLLSPEQVSAALDEPHSAPLIPEEHPKVRYGRLMSLLRAGQPAARRQVLAALNRVAELEPYELELRERVARNFRRELERSLGLSESEAAELVRVATR